MDGCLPLHLSSSSGPHVEYKLSSCGKACEEGTYHSSALNNHSITSGSSNHTELMRAYDFGKRLHHQVHESRSQCIGAEVHKEREQQRHLNPSYFDDDELEGEEDAYIMKSNVSQVSESDTQTDPGIRQFTKSPPRPNETRISACLSARGRHGNKGQAAPTTAAGHLLASSPDRNHRHHQLRGEERETDEEEDDDESGKTDEEEGNEGTEDSDPAVDESESESVLTASPASTCSEDERSSASSLTPTNDAAASVTRLAILAQARGTKARSDDQERETSAMMRTSVIAAADDRLHPKSSSTHNRMREQEHRLMNHADGRQRIPRHVHHSPDQQSPSSSSSAQHLIVKSPGSNNKADGSSCCGNNSRTHIPLHEMDMRSSDGGVHAGMMHEEDNNEAIDPSSLAMRMRAEAATSLHQVIGSKVRSSRVYSAAGVEVSDKRKTRVRRNLTTSALMSASSAAAAGVASGVGGDANQEPSSSLSSVVAGGSHHHRHHHRAPRDEESGSGGPSVRTSGTFPTSE